MSNIAPAIGPTAEYNNARRYQDKVLESRLIDQTTLPLLLANLPVSGQRDPALTWYEEGVRTLHLGYAEFRAQIRSMAYWLVANHSVRRGDRVIVISSNCPEALAVHLALMSIGAITVPVSNTESIRVLDLIIDQVSPRLLLVGRRAGSSIQSVKNRLTVQIPSLPLATATASETWRWPAPDVSADDAAVILFTSGTTSAPKGVCLSHYNLLVNAEGLSRTHNLSHHRVHMCVLPLFHANAFGFSMIASIYAGNHIVLCDGFPGYSIWSIIREERVNIVSLVPEYLRVLSEISVPRQTLHDLKYVVSAAAPLSKSLAREFYSKTGIAIHQGYGLSECVNFATGTPWDVRDEKLERLLQHWPVPSIGPALFGVDVRVRKFDGSVAEPDEEGEIVVSGHTVMLGYWGAAEATRDALGEGFLRTGDLGFFALVDGEPHFFVTGRRKEIVIRYGENISPFTVEAELEAIQDVGRFAIVGFPNEAAGEEIGLYIEAERTPVSERTVLEIVRRCTERYRPRVLVFGRQPIPRTPTGKIKRASLAGEFAHWEKRSFGSEPIFATAR
jgi:acyl-CoA synthetase (AMP-forming)/AMP-acid ligase II